MDNANQDQPTSPEALWESFTGQGSEKSFKVLFDHFYPELHGYGRKLGGGQTQVEDCLQELFKDLWRRRDGLDHIRSPQVYLFVSLRRKIIRAQQRQRRRDSLSKSDETTFIEFSREELIIRDEVKFEQKKELKHALNNLPGRQREVIYLYFYQGMSYGEIEDIMSIRRQSVHNHMYRALEQLCELLNPAIMRRISVLLLAVLSPFCSLL